MTGDSFPAKVAALREAWLMRRHLKHLSNQRDLRSRFELLQVLYRWSHRSLDAIAQVYGQSLAIELTPAPELETGLLSFAVALERDYRVSFALHPRDGAAGQWELDVHVTTPDSVLAAGQGRRAGQWTPGRVEELLLSLLAAIERARFDAYRPARGQGWGEGQRSSPGRRDGASAAGL